MHQDKKLNVIALISGGKDSLYSIAHCLRNGHSVIALANLHPPTPPTTAGPRNGQTPDEGEDMDSFMYQTIGHGVVPLYEEALGIPLYRDVIRGSALNAEREYSLNVSESVCTERADDEARDSDEDETESLTRLLRRIMGTHPAANAVSAGAILSTYQRTRIENVAARLGLIPLAWLWMYPYLPPPLERVTPASVTGLLDDMAAAGCEARIIKVASAGLESADVLWGDLAGTDGRVRRALVKTMGRFLESGLEAAVLGEGGEYESLGLDGPAGLWKKRIVVDEVESVTGEAGVVSARIKGARCVSKEVDEAEGGLSCVKKPEAFDEAFGTLATVMKEKHGKICRTVAEETYEEAPSLEQLRMSGDELPMPMPMSVATEGDAWYVTNCSAPEAGTSSTSQIRGIVEKVQNVFQSSESRTSESTPCTDDIVFATILLRSMGDFVDVNSVYSSLFSKPNPPARVTVACGESLPAGVNVVVSLVVDTGQRANRRGLHVQSRSYWAPANIGPYSQAIGCPLRKNTRLETDGGLVYVAGQIPLQPETMELTRPFSSGDEECLDTFMSQAVLSLQHLWRIGRTMEMDWWLGGIAFLAKDNENAHSKASIVADMWSIVNERKEPDAEDDTDEYPTFDAWDIKYGQQLDPRRTNISQERPLPNFNILDPGTADSSETIIPPLFVVQVKELPRGAGIEWQGLGTRTSDVTITHEDTGNIWVTGSRGSGFGSYSYIGIRTAAEADIDSLVADAIPTIADDKENDCSQQVIVVMYTACQIRCERYMCQIIPCKSVWGPDGGQLAAGVVVHIRPK